MSIEKTLRKKGIKLQCHLGSLGLLSDGIRKRVAKLFTPTALEKETREHLMWLAIERVCDSVESITSHGQTLENWFSDSKFLNTNVLNAFFDHKGDQFVVTLSAYKHQAIPSWVTQLVQAGEVVQWEARGFVWESSPIHANDQIHLENRVIATTRPPNDRTHTYKFRQIGEAPTFVEAINAALNAPEFEIN